MELQGKKVLVVGSGKSGIGAAGLLGKIGALPVIFDSNEKLCATDIKEKAGHIPELEVRIGLIPEEEKKEFVLVVLSPGVPADLPMLEEYRRFSVPIWGEIELAYEFSKGKLIAITGTNGKTTTTTLVGEIMSAYNAQTFVVGNIGNPYTKEVCRSSEQSVTVAEISSFQLETVDTFRPRVSAILNVTPDHLNRHHTMEAYVEVKERIAMRQTREDICVLNYENACTRDFGDRCPASVVYFSSGRELPDGYFLKGEEIFLAEGGRARPLLNIHRDMNLVGICNAENVMAAIALARGLEVPMETILRVVKEFHAVEHRIEYVATKGGVAYYNDSKGTNPDAAIQGIRAMSRPTVLIGGGYDKESEYDEWIENFAGKVKWLVLVGQTREKIAACARAHGFDRIRMADSFEECMRLCTRLAQEGDAVLLSRPAPAGACFPTTRCGDRCSRNM